MYLQQYMAKNKNNIKLWNHHHRGNPVVHQLRGLSPVTVIFFWTVPLVWYSDRAYQLVLFQKEESKSKLAWLPASLLVEGSVSLWNTCQHFYDSVNHCLKSGSWSPDLLALRLGSLMIFVFLLFLYLLSFLQLRSCSSPHSSLILEPLHFCTSCVFTCSGFFSCLLFLPGEAHPDQAREEKRQTQSRIWLVRSLLASSLLPSFSEVVPCCLPSTWNTPVLWQLLDCCSLIWLPWPSVSRSGCLCIFHSWLRGVQ